MRILFVSTIGITLRFVIPHIQSLITIGHQVDVAFSDDTASVTSELEAMGCKIWQVPLRRAPLRRGNIYAIWQLRGIVQKGQYGLVHVHTPIAAACVRLACFSLKGVKVVYTAHGFHFYQGAPLLNWLVYYPMEKLLSRYTDALIVINDEDWGIAKSRFHAKRLYHVPGVGVDLSRFAVPATSKEEMRHCLNIPMDAFLLVSVGELNINKNHEAVIRSIACLGDEAARVYYVICGQGKKETHLRQLAETLGLASRVLLLGHREDIPCILHCADVFVMPSLREGLPVSVMEAMAAKLPIVASNIRGNRDLIVENEGGYLRRPQDIETIAKAIGTLMLDTKLCSNMGTFNAQRVRSFSREVVMPLMARVYDELLDDC